MKTFREIVDEVMRRSPPQMLVPHVMADCMQAIADEMDRRYPPTPREVESDIERVKSFIGEPSQAHRDGPQAFIVDAKPKPGT